MPDRTSDVPTERKGPTLTSWTEDELTSIGNAEELPDLLAAPRRHAPPLRHHLGTPIEPDNLRRNDLCPRVPGQSAEGTRPAG